MTLYLRVSLEKAPCGALLFLFSFSPEGSSQWVSWCNGVQSVPLESRECDGSAPPSPILHMAATISAGTKIMPIVSILFALILSSCVGKNVYEVTDSGIAGYPEVVINEEFKGMLFTHLKAKDANGDSIAFDCLFSLGQHVLDITRVRRGEKVAEWEGSGVYRCVDLSEPAFPFNKDRWEIVDKQEEDLDMDGQKETIYLLSTIDTVDYSGASGDTPDERAVKMVITEENRKEFEFSFTEDRGQDLRGQKLSVGDLSGDGIPEVTVDTGFDYASDFLSCTNIISFDNRIGEYRLILPELLCESFNVGIQLHDLTTKLNGIEVLRSQPVEGFVGGNKVEQIFDITVYSWVDGNLSPYKSFRSTRPYEGGSFAVAGELYQIQKQFWVTPNDVVVPKTM